MATLLQEDSWRGNRLVDDVIAKAEGVFLWVDLAVKILLKGLTNKDDWDMMEKRLDLLPKGIESLYIHMWNRLGEDQKLYRETAALYFRIILLKEISLLQFSIATNENLQSILLDFTSPPPRTEDVISMCENAKIRVLTRCAGFLEVDHHDISYGDETQEDELDEDELDKNELDEDRFNKGGPPDEADDDPRLKQLRWWTKVRFLHRTARDFLLETMDGQAILGENPPPASSPHILLCKSQLGLDRLLPMTSPVDLLDVLDRVRDAQTAESAALESLMDIIESYFSTKHSGFSANSNWVENYSSSSRYGPLRGPATDFLGLMVGRGVHLDKSKRFLRHIQRADPPLTSYLLSCAVSNYGYPVRLELVLILLLNGADPNTIVKLYSGSPASCWDRFLYGIKFRRDFYDTYPSSTTDLCETIEAFLNNGADLHGKIPITYQYNLSRTSLGEKFKNDVMRLRQELSARHIVTDILRHNPRFSKIEERFESAGVQASRRLLSAHHESLADSKLHEPVSEHDFRYLSETIDESWNTAIIGYS